MAATRQSRSCLQRPLHPSRMSGRCTHWGSPLSVRRYRKL